jgi:6-phosphogluconolactonase (cycloisomerase 2 family)
MKTSEYHRVIITSALATTLAFAAPLGSSYAEIDDPGSGDILRRSEHVVYTETNDVANAVLAFRRDDEGRLRLLPGAPFSTGGKGVIDPSFKLGPFDTDQNVAIDQDRRLLFAVNSGSNSIAVFHIRPHDGSLEPAKGSPFPSGGINPVSIGLRGDQIVIINQDLDPAQNVPRTLPSIVTRHVTEDGRIVKFPTDTTISLPVGSAPSQALTANDRPFVFDAQFLGGRLASYQLSPNGRLIANPPQPLPASESVGGKAPLPLGLWANPDARQLYVGFVTVNKLGVYTWDEDGVPIFERTVANSGTAICWLRTNRAGTRLYTANTGSSTVSVYDTTDPAEPKEIQAIHTSGPGALFQLALDPTERFLYVIGQRGSHAAPGNTLHVLAVDDEDGTLSEVPSSPVPITLQGPDGRPQGVAVF